LQVVSANAYTNHNVTANSKLNFMAFASKFPYSKFIQKLIQINAIRHFCGGTIWKKFQISISVVNFGEKKNLNLKSPEFEAGCYFLIPVTETFYKKYHPMRYAPFKTIRLVCVCTECFTGNGRFRNGCYGAESPFLVTHPAFLCTNMWHIVICPNVTLTCMTQLIWICYVMQNFNER
jgi:hypothetical protein